MMSNFPSYQHTEVDEDGRHTSHPGYVMFTCSVCGKQFPLAKPISDMLSRPRTCGLVSCENNQKKELT